MAYSFSCSFFNILHVLNTCRFLFPYIKPTYVLYLLVYFSILLYRNESERRKTESWKEVQMASRNTHDVANGNDFNDYGNTYHYAIIIKCVIMYYDDQRRYRKRQIIANIPKPYFKH